MPPYTRSPEPDSAERAQDQVCVSGQTTHSTVRVSKQTSTPTTDRVYLCVTAFCPKRNSNFDHSSLLKQAQSSGGGSGLIQQKALHSQTKVLTFKFCSIANKRRYNLGDVPL